MRIHGTTAQCPVETVSELEAPGLLAVPEPYDVSCRSSPGSRVHRDSHVEVAWALHSVSEQWIGQHLDARADFDLVKRYSTRAGAGRLVTTVARRYGPGPVETACSRSLDLDVVSVSTLASRSPTRVPLGDAARQDGGTRPDDAARHLERAR